MVVITNFPPPMEGIKVEQPLVSVFFNEDLKGKGTLYVAESRLSWVQDTTEQGFSLEYPSMTMYAISRDIEAHGHECILVVVDTGPGTEGEDSEVDNEDEEEDVDSNSQTVSVRLVPDDKNSLYSIYNAMKECSALHPDPDESISEDDIYEDADEENDGNIYTNGYQNSYRFGLGNQTSNGQNHNELMETEGQFEDAESEQED
uniref:Methylosome subunit pICln n=2 Tax=Clastoptera arizonana TaxID=38151 RepID=A0A1B6CHU2_9HEMI